MKTFPKSIQVTAEFDVDRRPRNEKDNTRSPELESLFSQRQIAKDEN